MRTAIWTCAGRGGIGRARASALGGGRPRGGRVGCGGVPEARRMWRQIDIRNVRAATRPDGSKAAWIARKKAKGETANAQIAESTGVKAGRAQPCGPAPPPLASRHPIPAAHGQAVGRPAGAPRARRGSRAAATARRARPHQAARGPLARHGTGQPRSRRRAGAARVVHIERGTDTHPAQDMHGSKADGVAPKAKKVVRGGRGHSKNAAGQQARPPREHSAVGGPFHSEGQEPHRSARGAVQLRRKHMPAGQGEAPHACARKMPPRVHGHGQATWHPCRRE